MRRILCIGLLCVFATSPLQAQEPVEIYGYFESQVSGTVLGDAFFQLYSNKLRVDLQSSLNDQVSFAANFDYITYHGKKNWNVLNVFPEMVTGQVPAAQRPFYALSFGDRNFLDNAYARIALERADITVGKQQISLGTGYVWNPMDVFNIKDVLDPTYEQPGHNAIRVDVPMGLRSTATALYSPESTWDRSTRMLQFKTGIGHFDFTLLGLRQVWTFHDYSQFDVQNGGFPGDSEARSLYGISTAGELLGLGVWAEYGYNVMETSDDFQELVIGGNYTFDFQTFVMAEYYHNSLGKSLADDYTLTDWMRMFANEQKTITRDQVYLLAQHPVGDFIYTGLSGIVSLSDGSMALVPTLDYSFAQNMELTAYLSLNFGDDNAMFSPETGHGGLIRARIYF